jgi:hypothetical protein
MTEALKAKTRDRASNCCEYCHSQAEFSHDPFSAEHIYPTIKGGQDILENLAWSCLGCNFHKFTSTEALDLVSNEYVPLYNPRIDIWKNHFRWNDDFTLIIGLTPIGRATVSRLKLNRQGIINLRKILADAGKHPPY